MNKQKSISWRIQAGSFFRDILRDPSVILWNVLWPVILCALYLVAFSGFGNWHLEPIYLAIHEDSQAKLVFEQVAKAAQTEAQGENNMGKLDLRIVSVASDAEGQALLYPHEAGDEANGADGALSAEGGSAAQVLSAEAADAAVPDVANTDPDGSAVANTGSDDSAVANTDSDGSDVANTDPDGSAVANTDSDGSAVANTDPNDSDVANTGSDDSAVANTDSTATKAIAYIDADDQLYYPAKEARKPELQIVTAILDSYVPLRGIIDDAIEQGLPLAKIPSLLKGVPEIASLRPQAMDVSPMILSYLNLFSMCSIMGCFSTQSYLYYIQADQSAIGMRVATSPRKKSRFLGISFLLGLVTVLFSLLLLMVFMHYTVGIDLLSHFWSNLYLFFISTSAMLCLGFFIGVLPLSVDAKSGICLTFTLFLPFLAGMMSPDLAFMFRARAPYLLDLNPAYQLSNEIIRINRLGLPMRTGFLTLFFFIFGALFFGLALNQLRRQQFKSLARG